MGSKPSILLDASRYEGAITFDDEIDYYRMAGLREVDKVNFAITNKVRKMMRSLSQRLQ